MFRFIRSARVSGSVFEGLQFAQEVASHVNQSFPSQNVQVFAEMFGDFGTIFWMSDSETLADIEEMNGKLMVDEKYIELVSKGPDLFIAGSMKDRLVQLMG